MKIKEVISYLEDLAPLEYQEEWDNSGFQLGSRDKEVKGILICLDVTQGALDKCKDLEYNLIISHHPLIFSPIESLDYEKPNVSTITRAIKNDIAIYSAHTNLDATLGGVNDVLAEKLGFDLVNILETNSYGTGIGRYGNIEKTSLGDLANHTSKALGTSLIYYGDKDKEISSLAISGGSGGSMIKKALDLGVDALITGDIKHHDHIDALAGGLALIDAGHYKTEIPVCYKLKDYLLTKGLSKVYVYENDLQKTFVSLD